MFALAVFALTGNQIAYHTGDSLLLDLVGHHASMPLAFVILYHEYRFALADRFLKSALAIIAVVSIAMGAYMLVVARLGDSLRDSAVVASVLALWIATTLVYPEIQRGISGLVDRWFLGRDSYGNLRASVAESIESIHTSSEVLNSVAGRLAQSFNAARVRWAPLRKHSRELDEMLADVDDVSGDVIARALGASGAPELVWFSHRGDGAAVVVPTAESPRYLCTLAELSEGRRLRSEDAVFLEWVALRAARRIDRLRTVHERYEHELREQEIKKLATEAELKALRAQVNPHFLFNALTTIGHLIQTAPERAMDTLLNLTDLLRRVLRSTDEWTSLGEELDLVCAYLDIERARFEERLESEIDVPDELRRTHVPPLILQPLVENAIKHGVAPSRDGGSVKVSAELADGVLLLTVEDSGAGAGTTAGEGVGLKNVEERLRGYYGDDASIAMKAHPGSGTTVELRLPAHRSRRRSPRRVQVGVD
jgi:signal transduction histidine kinase